MVALTRKPGPATGLSSRLFLNEFGTCGKTTSRWSAPEPATAAVACAGTPPRGFLDFLMLQLSRLDWRKGLAALIGGVLLLVFGLGYLVWRHQRLVDPLKDLKPGLYQSTQSLSGETLPMTAPKR